MKISLLFGFSLLPLCIMAQQMTEPLLIPQLYTWKIAPNGKWLSGGTREVCDVYNMEERSMESYWGAKYSTITNNGMLTIGGEKPTLLINGEPVIPESLKGARGGSIQCISSTGNRLCGNINYPDAGINGFYVCDIDENGIVGEPKQLPRPTLDFFGCKPQFVNMIDISADGSTITGFVQDWRGYYCYPIIFRENEEGEWVYNYPTESLFNPDNYPIPENPWLEEPKFPEFTDYMTPIARDAYDEAMEKYYSGLSPEFPDAKDFMTEEQWEAYYEAAVSYNEWFYGYQEKINSYDREYNKILFSSVIFDLNEIAISPDGSLIGCSYIEYLDEEEVAGIMKINTLAPEFSKYKSVDDELYTTQILSDGTMLLSQPMNMSPESYIILPDKKEMIDIKDYFKDTHPDYLLWINENAGNTGTIYTNDNLTMFVGSILPGDCEKVEEVIGGYYSFTYVFSPEHAAVEDIQIPDSNRYQVFSLQGYKILDTDNKEDLRVLPKDIYIINGRKVKLN